MQIAQQARGAILLVGVLTVITGFAYPLAITGIAQFVFPYQANGSLIQDRSGANLGSELIGQNFSSPRYFHPRPSSAGSDGYDATASGGSNLGPTNRKLLEVVQERVAAYREENGLAAEALVPVDAVTASAGGLDPHITPANAALQVPRVARERSIPEADVRALLARTTEGRTFGILGEPRVNVLLLNLALDSASER